MNTSLDFSFHSLIKYLYILNWLGLWRFLQKYKVLRPVWWADSWLWDQMRSWHDGLCQSRPLSQIQLVIVLIYADVLTILISHWRVLLQLTGFSEIRITSLGGEILLQPRVLVTEFSPLSVAPLWLALCRNPPALSTLLSAQCSGLWKLKQIQLLFCM